MRGLLIFIVVVFFFVQPVCAFDDFELFRTGVSPLLEKHCLSCHNDGDHKGGFSLESAEAAFRGGESGKSIVAGKSAESQLLDWISGDDPEMPQDGRPLTKKEVATIRDWIDSGAKWPDGFKLKDRSLASLDWWSLKPLRQPELPKIDNVDTNWSRTVIDQFIIKKLREKNLHPSRMADRRTIIRRLTYDLHGLPPTPAEIDRFVNDQSDAAYEELVDRLLDSPRYGEHWARHWLDVVHYADTHGYDKDKPRPNAWPYRDYVIRSFNQDKPYGRFVQEQIAGDVLWPNTKDGVVAVGFIATGPWDFIGHVEVPETKFDGKVARNLDRDDMVTNAMNSFVSFTAQCARCHNHKFDPMTMEDYYSLQAVFAAVDRANRPYESNPADAETRFRLTQQKMESESKKSQLEKSIAKRAGAELINLDKQIAQLAKKSGEGERPEFGYHSKIERKPNVSKWVQVDLGKAEEIEKIVLVGCHDTFNNIGAGFGFPARYRIDLSDDQQFQKNVTTVVDRTDSDAANPGVVPQAFEFDTKRRARYIRVTATKLAERKNDFILALGELSVFTTEGENVAFGVKVTSLDSIQAPVRWQRKNLVDGYYYGMAKATPAGNLAELKKQRKELVGRITTVEEKEKLKNVVETLKRVDQELSSLPRQQMVYAAATHFKASGNSKPTLGKPREIRLLERGDIKKPGKLMVPGTVPIIPQVAARFELQEDHSEADRRVALAKWITRADNPLTWRSIVNRIWSYHFGRGIVDSPNDFGRGGQLPSQPKLLDWLAVEFRDGGQSFKQIHKMIVMSSVYRQVSSNDAARAKLDGSNVYLWRMNRRRLTAEEIRDSVLAVSGKLSDEMGGPGFQDFVIEKPQHSPHYEYHLYNPDDVKTHRRAVYRFIVRSQPQPLMNALDCADPAQSVPKRDETLTALQALALLNNRFMVRMAENFATRLQKEHAARAKHIEAGFRLISGRDPTVAEAKVLLNYCEEFGLANTCRVMLNLNEFVFID